MSIQKLTRFLALAALLPIALPAGAQQAPRDTPRGGLRPISLDQALRLGEAHSEEVRIARAAVQRARGQQLQARSQLLPQLYGSLEYTRTLRSQFEEFASSAGGDTTTPPTGPDSIAHALCAPYYLRPDATLAERQAALDLARTCTGSGGGLDFSNLPFGQKNQYTIGLSGRQTLFAGGRIFGANTAANAGREAAEVGLTSARAQLQLAVTEAYYDAVLSDRLLAIAVATLDQTENTLRQTQLARNVGNTSQFELLRAQVTRDNQRPVVIQSRTTRDLAYLRLKQLLEVSLDDSLVLTTDIQDTLPVPGLPVARTASLGSLGDDTLGTTAPDTAGVLATTIALADTAADARAPVRQALENVRAREGLLRMARSQRYPELTLSTQYGRLAYPRSGMPDWSQFVQNWTVTLGLQVPLFTGGRIRGEALVAQADLSEAQAQYEQVRELAALDARAAVAEMQEAQSAWSASVGTVEQASRAYTIAEVRYREGISTQLELNESRNLLQQATANRARAARDLQVARMRVALLKDLPLGGVAAGAGGQARPAQQQPQQQQPSQGTGQPAQSAGVTRTGFGGRTAQ